jgi:hypothetical protein
MHSRKDVEFGGFVSENSNIFHADKAGSSWNEQVAIYVVRSFKL